jgi:hypothetical protein
MIAPCYKAMEMPMVTDVRKCISHAKSAAQYAWSVAKPLVPQL